VKRLTLFITGTDTGAGKTFLACLLARHLRAQGFPVAALKPVCSGGRGDAKALHAALPGALALDEINPWYFRAPIAPLLAARVEKRKVKLVEVVAHARRIHKRFPVLIVEGAGGVLSPLGEDFDSRGLIKALRAVPVVVCPNRLGAINQVLLALTALPRDLSRKAQVVLVSQKKPHDSSEGNLLFLSKKLGRRRVHKLPWLENGPGVRRLVLEVLTHACIVADNYPKLSSAKPTIR
jgi:dethiobiotin synthetase